MRVVMTLYRAAVPRAKSGPTNSMENSRLFLFAALIFVAMLMWQQWRVDYYSVPVSSAETITSAGSSTAVDIGDIGNS